eukprot:4720796-Prymnesium_polylepis.1
MGRMRDTYCDLHYPRQQPLESRKERHQDYGDTVQQQPDHGSDWLDEAPPALAATRALHIPRGSVTPRPGCAAGRS